MIQQEARPMEDFMMWAMLQPNAKVNIPALKESCGDLIKMAVQKTSGMRSDDPKTYLSIENLERVRMNVLAGGVALAKSGLLDSIGDAPAEQERDFKDEYPTWDFLHSDKCKKWDYRRAGTFDHLKPGNVEPDIESLKHWVTVFERYMKGEADIKEIGDGVEYMKNAILCETVSLVLSGKLELLGKEVNA